MDGTSNEIIKLLIIDGEKNETNSDEFNYNIELEIVNNENNDNKSEFTGATSTSLFLDTLKNDGNSCESDDFREDKEECISDKEYSCDETEINDSDVFAATKMKRILTCEVCQYKTFLKYQLERHMMIHMEHDQFLCKICRDSFETKDELKEHLNVHRCPINKKLFKCNFCEYTSKHSNVFYHTLMHYKDKNEFLCEECSFRTTCISLLEKHKRKHKATYTVCPICLKDLGTTHQRRIHLQRYRSPDDPKVFKCPQCDYSSSLKNLKKHMIRHRKKDEIECHICSFCDFRTKRKSDLSRHERYVHQTGDTLKCHHCEYTTNGLHNLTRHVRKRHPEFAYVRDCGMCGFRTYTEDTFQQHKSIHKREQESLILCAKCGFQCVSKEILDKHLKIHEYTCDVCGFLTESEKIANIHKTLHEQKGEYRCRECSFHVPSKKIYINHLKVHNIKLSEIMASYESKNHKEKVQLKKNLRTSENILKCALCDYTCKLRLFLYKHISKHGREYQNNFEDYIQPI